MLKLSILVPIYNENKTLLKILRKLENLKFKKIKVKIEILILLDSRSDDGSKDTVKKFLEDTKKKFKLFYINKPGKGYAIKLGFKRSKGNIILIQDADLEYDINDYEKLLKPIILNKTDFVLGTRFKKKNSSAWKLRNIKDEKLYGFFLNIGGVFINFLMNILYNVRIEDQATMYKVFKKKILKGINLYTNNFETEVELLCKLFKKNIIPLQIPIKYKARSNKEGKKIKFFSDGWSFIKTIIIYRFVN